MREGGRASRGGPAPGARPPALRRPYPPGVTGDHAFLPDGTHLITGDEASATRMTGHQQVTDAHLFAVAASHHAALATFDRALVGRGTAGGSVVVIPV